MNRKLIACVLMGMLFGVALPVLAAEGGKGAEAPKSLVDALKAHNDASVTLRLHSGEELTGKLKMSSGDVIVLQALSGRDFFDAVVPVEAIEALIVRRPAP